MKNYLLIASMLILGAVCSCNDKPETPQDMPEFRMSDSPLSFAAENPAPQSVAVISAGVEWDAEVNPEAAEWLSAEKLAGKIRVTATTNDTSEPRSGVVTVTPAHADFKPVKITVSQAAKGTGPGGPELPAEVDFDMIYSAEYNGDKFGTGGGHFAISFMNVVSTQNAIFESFTLEGFMPLVTDENAGFVSLAPGTYTYEHNESYTGAPFKFLSYYGEVSNLGTYYMSTLYGTGNLLFYPVYGGTVTVSDAGNGNIGITADVVDDSGKAMKVTYTGPLMLDNTTVEKEAAYNATFDVCNSAQDLGQYFSQPIREYELQFAKTSTIGQDNVIENLVLRFETGVEAEGGIPSGRYFPFTTVKNAPRAPYTYMRGGAGYGMTVGSYYIHSSYLYGVQTYVFFDRDGGYIDVENHGDGTYTIAVRVIGTGADNNMEITPDIVVNCDFTGPVTFTNAN